MNIDIEGFLGIIIMVIILIISGLGSRRRKQAQMKQAASAPPQPGDPGTEDPSYAPSARPAVDPFERLEQILTGQSPFETMERAPVEDLQEEEDVIVDETPAYQPEPLPQQKARAEETTDETEEGQTDLKLDKLFQDLDEITRAIIYSEILPRRY
jgi:hypothetical protein